MSKNYPRRIGYILKRYPRLSETFILNEILALEQLGVELHIFSLLRPEENIVHDSIREVKATVTYIPAFWPKRVTAVLGAHFYLMFRLPTFYFKALRLALKWMVMERSPLDVPKQFMRAGYFAYFCREMKIEHLHAHFANTPTRLARWIGILLNFRYSFTAHAKDLYLTPKPLLSESVASSAFVITCTNYNVAYFKEVLPENEWSKIRLIYHGVDQSRLMFNHRVSRTKEIPKTFSILSVGRLVPKKGFSSMIAALKLLKDKGIPFECLIVGGGALKDSLQKQIDQNHLQNEVVLKGPMIHEEVIRLMKRFHLFVLAPQILENGDRDGIPNVLVEAMALGMPVISTNISGIPELIESGRTGILVPAENPSVLADAMEQVYHKYEWAQIMASAAAAKVEKEFNTKANARKLVALFQ